MAFSVKYFTSNTVKINSSVVLCTKVLELHRKKYFINKFFTVIFNCIDVVIYQATVNWNPFGYVPCVLFIDNSLFVSK